MQILEMHTLFVYVTVKIDWSSRVRWLCLPHAFEVRPAFGGAVIS